MPFDLIGSTADVLAKSRRHNVLCELPPGHIATREQAYEILAATEDAYGFEQGGYAVVGSSESSRRTFGLLTPIFSEIPTPRLLMGQDRFMLPVGIIGAQCEFAFSIRRTFPDAGEPITCGSVAEALLGCMPAIGILGRRTRNAFGGSEAAIADFALHAATICGEVVTGLAAADLSTGGSW